MRQNCVLLLYELVKGFKLNVGRIIEQSIQDYVDEKFSGNIPYPSLITFLCIKGDVKFRDIKEEKFPKSSLLTLTGITKGPVEGEEEEIRQSRKRKRT